MNKEQMNHALDYLRNQRGNETTAYAIGLLVSVARDWVALQSKPSWLIAADYLEERGFPEAARLLRDA